MISKLAGTDLIVFTGGIGENDAEARVLNKYTQQALRELAGDGHREGAR